MKKYLIGGILAIIITYFSINIQALDTYKKTDSNVDFIKLANDLYNQIQQDKNQVSLFKLKEQLKTNKDQAFLDHGNRLGIGQSAYFMVKGSGFIQNISETEISLKDSTGADLLLSTKFIFGNAIRDASNKVKLTDFKTNAEFNKLSEALNDLIRDQVLPSKIKNLKTNDKIIFTGAIKFSKKYDLPEKLVLVNIEKI